jgi:hypothetical protein
MKLFCLLIFCAFSTSVLGQKMPASLEMYTDTDLDGVWQSTDMKVVRDLSSCPKSVSMKFTIKNGKIFKDGFTQGAFYGSVSSTVFGVVHKDKSVDLTILDNRSLNGRSNQIAAKISNQGEMLIEDVGGNCSYSFVMVKK